MYNIPLKKLVNLANPFKQIAFKGYEFPLEKDFITTALKNVDIFEKVDGDQLQNIIRKIAYLVNNYNSNDFISINLENNDSGWLLEGGSELLAAAIFRDEEHIYADIKGSEKVITKIFGNINQITLTHPHTLKKIVWAVDEIPTSSTWDNVDYIIKKLTETQKQKSSIQDVLRFIVPDVWNNTENIRTILAKTDSSVIANLSKEIVESDVYFDVIKQNYHTFSSTWKHFYNKDYPSDSPINTRITREIFTNAKICRELLGLSYDIGSLYKYFSDEVKLNPEIVDYLYAQSRKDHYDKVDLIKSLIPKYFLKEENTIRFLQDLDYISNPEIYPYIYNQWIDDKEKIIQFLKVNKIKSIAYFYELIPKHIKEDKDFIIAFLPFSSEIMNDLKIKHFRDKDILEAIINNKRADRIPEDIIFSLTNIDLIKTLVAENYDILRKKNTPSSWTSNDEIISAVPTKNLIWLPDKIINRYLSSEKNCIASINKDKDIYNCISYKLKLIHNVSLTYLEIISNDEKNKKYIENVPSQLWGSKDFCLMAMAENFRATEKVPSNFFSDPEFINEFFIKLDNYSLDKKCLNLAPKEIKQTLDAYEITDNYERFIKSYLLNKDISEKLIDDKKNFAKKPKL